MVIMTVGSLNDCISWNRDFIFYRIYLSHIWQIWSDIISIAIKWKWWYYVTVQRFKWVDDHWTWHLVKQIIYKNALTQSNVSPGWALSSISTPFTSYLWSSVPCFVDLSHHNHKCDEIIKLARRKNPKWWYNSSSIHNIHTWWKHFSFIFPQQNHKIKAKSSL